MYFFNMDNFTKKLSIKVNAYNRYYNSTCQYFYMYTHDCEKQQLLPHKVVPLTILILYLMYEPVLRYLLEQIRK